MKRSVQLLAAAAAAGGAAAQAPPGATPDWGTTGAWELLAPTNAGPALAYRSPTTVAGNLVLGGNDTFSGFTAAWAYDPIGNAWGQWPDAPVAIGDPFMLTIGGHVILLDETTFSTFAFIDAAAARSTVGYSWTVLNVPGGPATTRFGQRYLAWGGVIYAFGGVELSTGVAHNDLWALDASALINQVTPPARWVQVQPDGVTGFPPGRVGYSVTPFGGGAVMYGGVSVDNSPGVLPMVCFSPSTSSVCHFHTSVWVFLPGVRQPEAGSITGAQWLRLADAGAYGGPAPVGRFDHVAGAVGDQLFVHGGTTAAGPVSELWAFNLVSHTWQAVAPSAPSPAVSSDLGWGVGAVIGRHLYRYAQATDPVSGMPLPGTGQLWRWAPVASAGAVTPAAPAPGTHPGVVAALVIGLLLIIVNTGLLVAVARHADALPEGLMTCGGVCSRVTGRGGSGRVPPGDGFYTSVHEDKAGGSGEGLPPSGYAPPL